MSNALTKAKAYNDLYTTTARRNRTSFIFAIAEFERIFGYLWRHDDEDDNFTEEEQKFFDLYQEFRKSVLDMGNKQIRQMEYDLGKFDIDFKVKGKQ